MLPSWSFGPAALMKNIIRLKLFKLFELGKALKKSLFIYKFLLILGVSKLANSRMVS